MSETPVTIRIRRMQFEDCMVSVFLSSTVTQLKEILLSVLILLHIENYYPNIVSALNISREIHERFRYS